MASAIFDTVEGTNVHFASDHHCVVICEIKGPSGASSIGSARCAPEDTFDQTVGEQIAYVRALAAEAVMTLKDLTFMGVSPGCVLKPGAVTEIDDA